MAALRTGDPAEVGPLLSNDLQPAALSLQPLLRRALAAGREHGALGAIVSGSGPTCAFLASDTDAASELAVGHHRGRRLPRGRAGDRPGIGRLPGRLGNHYVNLVNLEAAVKAYGTRVLLDQVSLGVAAGDRIGLVGRNGSGKTTLLAALAGATDLNSGRSTRVRDASDRLPGPVGAAERDRAGGRVRRSCRSIEWAADVKARAMLSALIKDLDLDSRAEQLSGGEHRRVALAALLRGSYDLLLLDEPTNHLDIEAIGWLAGYLSTLGKAFVVVTHDRWFLDAVCDRTWELADGQVHAYEGGYSAYVLAKAERARLAAATEQRRQNLMRKELAWLRRGPPARTSKPKFRIEAATALIADEPAARDGVELSRLAAVRLGKTVLEAEGLTVGVGDRVLLRDVDWQLGPGDRVGVVGVNGSGKTSLLQVLAGSVEPVGGSVVRGKTVRLGYLTQEPAPVDPEPAGAGGGAERARVGPDRQGRAVGGAAAGAARVRGRPAVDAGSGAVGRGAAAAAAADGADGRAERAAAGRADERPGY